MGLLLSSYLEATGRTAVDIGRWNKLNDDLAELTEKHRIVSSAFAGLQQDYHELKNAQADLAATR